MREQIICHIEKTTPGALQYKQVNSNGEPIRRDLDGLVIGTLYLRKAAVKGNVPNKITVMIDY